MFFIKYQLVKKGFFKMSYQATSVGYGFHSNGGCSTLEAAEEMARQTTETVKKAVDYGKAVKNATKQQNDEFTPIKKTNYAKNGAIIALVSGIVVRAGVLGSVAKIFGKETLKNAIKNVSGSTGKYAALLAGALAVDTLIGAGIGKIMEKVKSKKQAE